jgi:hypothetical protein
VIQDIFYQTFFTSDVLPAFAFSFVYFVCFVVILQLRFSSNPTLEKSTRAALARLFSVIAERTHRSSLWHALGGSQVAQ